MAIDDNESYGLTGYQVKDLAQKIRAKADSSSLASVATSGLYADITGAPTVVQTTGQSTTDVMSQKAVTDLIGDVETILQTLNSGTGAQS